jgi:hypothetical protein
VVNKSNLIPDRDLGKAVFHLVGLNLRGEIAGRKKFSRTQLLYFTGADLHRALLDERLS